jgi:Flp pilus assembly protein TadD
MRGGFALLVAGGVTIVPGGASAQTAQVPPGAVVQPLPNEAAGAELRRHLTTIAENPRSVSALIGAGRAALDLGDPEAALAFFARAEEAAPSEPRAKAGMAAALVRMEQPRTALGFFQQAIAAGAPELEIAADRGLAYDMIGDPRRAQQDYALVLRTREEPEVRRRLALSLAVSGNREAALAAIDDQLRRQDRAAWRTRVLIHAVTGDMAGAEAAARATMTPQQVQAMAPFFTRLTVLDPSQKALAVHFGRFPANGQPGRTAQGTDTTAYPGAVSLAENGAGARTPDARTDRRRPGTESEATERIGPGSRPRPPARTRQADRRPAQTAPRQQSVAVAQAAPPQTAPAQTAPAQTAPAQIGPAQPAPSQNSVQVAEAAPPPPGPPISSAVGRAAGPATPTPPTPPNHPS